MIAPLFNSLVLALAITTEVVPLSLSAPPPSLTLDQKAGQFVGTTLSGLSRDDELDIWLRDRGVGLLIFYRADMQPQRKEQIRKAVARHASGGLAPLLAIDQEGGFVVRHDPAAIPSPMALGAAGSEDLAQRAGRFVGCSLRAAGIEVDFAPVLDLSSPLDSGIGTRSFGGDPAAVSRLGAAFVRGLDAGGVLSVAKHFPGQGFADADPHLGPSKSLRTGTEMTGQDLRPFREAIAAGLSGVMTAHVSYPSWNGADGAPASISRHILGTVLRGELAFEGLVVTDSIQMRGLGEDLGAGELAVRAVEAGADIILAPAPVERESVFVAIREAIRSGRLPEARVEWTLARLRAARAKQGGVPCETDGSIVDEVARASITRIGGAPPIDPASSFFIGPEGEIADRFAPERRRLLAIQPPRDPAAIEAGVAEVRACGPARLVALVHNASQAALVRALRKELPSIPLTLIAGGSPYDVAGIGADEYLFTYGWRPESVRALLGVLDGGSGAPGRLPVDVEGVGRMGEGSTNYAVSSEARESP